MNAALILTGLLFAVPAPAADPLACPVPAEVERRAFPQDIPQPLLADLKQRFGEFSGPKEPFNSTDLVTDSRPNRRVAFVWQNGTRWVFGTEHGGRGYSTPVLAYELDLAGVKVTFLSEERSTGGNCETARRWISP